MIYYLNQKGDKEKLKKEKKLDIVLTNKMIFQENK